MCQAAHQASTDKNNLTKKKKITVISWSVHNVRLQSFKKSKQLLRNSSDSCSEIFFTDIFFTDIVDRKVKTFDPRTTTAETLMGTGKEGTNDGTG